MVEQRSSRRPARRQAANQCNRPWGVTGPTPFECWQQRQRLCGFERFAFAQKVTWLRGPHRRRLGRTAPGPRPAARARLRHVRAVDGRPRQHPPGARGAWLSRDPEAAFVHSINRAFIQELDDDHLPCGQCGFQRAAPGARVLSRAKNWWYSGAENDAYWRSLSLRDKVYYEIGQKTVSDSNFWI